MNDKIIVVKGWNEIEIRKIVNDFVQTYESDGYPAYVIDAHKQVEHLFHLTFPKDIHPTLFTFLVNYLAYPFDLDFESRSIIVGGKTTLSGEFDGVDSAFVGQSAVFYVPLNDQDNDVVYMQTESGINLANSFTDMKWKRVSDARLSNEVMNLMQSSSS